MNINNLPQELLLTIFSYLNVPERKSTALVCQKWRESTKCPSFYNRIIFRGQVAIERAQQLWSIDFYHPFSVLKFKSIKEFPESLESLWETLGETLTELEICPSEGLDAFVLQKLLSQMPQIQRLQLKHIDEALRGTLSIKFPSVTVLEIDAPWPPEYLASLTAAFPNLQNLHLHCNRYVDTDFRKRYFATHAAFTGWLKNVANLSPQLTFHYEDPFMKINEVLLQDMMDISNLKIALLVVEIKRPSLKIFHKFIECKGNDIVKLQLSDAQLIQVAEFELINKNCNNLRELELIFDGASLVKSYPLEVLMDFKRLTSLFISIWPPNENFCFTKPVKKLHLPSITSLSLEGISFSHINEMFELFFEAVPNLQNLRIIDCKIVTGNIEKVAKECPKLESLDLVLCQLQCETLNAMKSLKTLRLSNCSNAEDMSPDTESLVFENLQVLKLIHFTDISPKSIMRISENCPNLKVLKLCNCTRLTQGDVSKLEAVFSGEWKKMPRCDTTECDRIFRFKKVQKD